MGPKSGALLAVLLIGAGAVIVGGADNGDAPQSSRVVIDVDQPSGMGWSDRHDGLWVISDKEPEIVLVARDGVVRDRLGVVDGGVGWEGVTETRSGELVVVQEDGNDILRIDPDSGELRQRIALSTLSGYGAVANLFAEGGKNKGLEGVSADPETGTVWMVKEGRPGVLLRISEDLSTIESFVRLDPIVAPHVMIDLDDLDFTGLSVDPTRPGRLWITSHRAKIVIEWDTEGDAVVAIHSIDASKLEGVAVDIVGSRLFLVDEKTSVLVSVSSAQVRQTPEP